MSVRHSQRPLSRTFIPLRLLRSRSPLLLRARLVALWLGGLAEVTKLRKREEQLAAASGRRDAVNCVMCTPRLLSSASDHRTAAAALFSSSFSPSYPAQTLGMQCTLADSESLQRMALASTPSSQDSEVRCAGVAPHGECAAGQR